MRNRDPCQKQFVTVTYRWKYAETAGGWSIAGSKVQWQSCASIASRPAAAPMSEWPDNGRPSGRSARFVMRRANSTRRIDSPCATGEFVTVTYLAGTGGGRWWSIAGYWAARLGRAAEAQET